MLKLESLLWLLYIFLPFCGFSPKYSAPIRCYFLISLMTFLMQSTEEGRKTAYDALIGVCSSLRDCSSAKSNDSYKKFVDMVSK